MCKRYVLFFFFYKQEAQSYADDNSLLFMETSAKTSMNVNEIFMAIGKINVFFPNNKCRQNKLYWDILGFLLHTVFL